MVAIPSTPALARRECATYKGLWAFTVNCSGIFCILKTVIYDHCFSFIRFHFQYISQYRHLLMDWSHSDSCVFVAIFLVLSLPFLLRICYTHFFAFLRLCTTSKYITNTWGSGCGEWKAFLISKCWPAD